MFFDYSAVVGRPLAVSYRCLIIRRSSGAPWPFRPRARAAARAAARARGELCIVHNIKVGPSVGLLKGPQKFQIQFLELHVDFSIVGNTELPTSARRRARGKFCIVHNIKVGPSVGLLKGPQKFQIQFLELHVDFSIVDNTELRTRTRARARTAFCGQYRTLPQLLRCCSDLLLAASSSSALVTCESAVVQAWIKCGSAMVQARP